MEVGYTPLGGIAVRRVAKLTNWEEEGHLRWAQTYLVEIELSEIITVTPAPGRRPAAYAQHRFLPVYFLDSYFTGASTCKA